MSLIILLSLLPLAQLVLGGDSQGLQTVASTDKLHSVRSLGSMICPRGPATGDNLGQKSVIIYHSPTTKKDVTLNYGNGWTDETMQTLVSNGFNSSKPTILYSHGFHQTGNQAWLENARTIYDKVMAMNTEPYYNMFIFDWSNYSNLHYWTSVSYVPHLGRILGEFLEKLGKSQSYDMDMMHLIGYSLSTHIVGLASRHVASSYAPIGQITALDPTGVCLHHDSDFANEYALRPSDAKFLVARHYNMNEYGARRPIGGLDIFVNGGSEQPMAPRERRSYLRSISARFRRDAAPAGEGALFEEEEEEELDDSNMLVMDRMDHRRATEHETQAMDDQCHDIAYECESYEAYLRGECANCGADGSKCYFVSNFKQMVAQSSGEQLRNGSGYAPGTKMFLKTHYQDPFCLHHYQLVAVLSSDFSNATKSILSNGLVEFIFPDGQTVPLQGPITGDRFTVLASTGSKIQSLSSITIKVNAVTSAYKDFLNSLDHMEMNYMSHYSPEERARGSFRLCLNADKTSLIKCNTATSL